MASVGLLWATILAVSLCVCRALIWGHFIQGAGGLVMGTRFKGACLSIHPRIRQLRVSNIIVHLRRQNMKRQTDIKFLQKEIQVEQKQLKSVNL